MSTVISIQAGAITGSRTFQNDTKSRDILLRFYTSQNLGPANATNQEKLQAIVNWLVAYVSEQATGRQVNTTRDAAIAQATQDNTFE
jgi:hypothetical protein